jgi:alkylation response protein AidB-like acyl-CoA dehydrogenase
VRASRPAGARGTGRRYVSAVGTAGADPLAVATRIADEELFPTAARVDAADALPRERLDLLAAAGLYGLAGPREAGGLEPDFPTFCGVIEALAGGDLTTAFVWVQHHGAVRALAADDASPALRDAELRPLCRGERRAGLALPGLHPGPSALEAVPAVDGWQLRGTAPWVTGWGLVDVVLVAARAPGDTVVWLLLDAVDQAGLAVARVPLLACHASVTVELRFDGVRVDGSREIRTTPYDPAAWTSGGDLRVNGSLALGVAGRCCRLLDDDGLRRELADHRASLDSSPPQAMAEARAAASALASRVATRLMVTAGSRAVVRGHPAERLIREATFLLVFGSRPAIKTSLLRLVR